MLRHAVVLDHVDFLARGSAHGALGGGSRGGIQAVLDGGRELVVQGLQRDAAVLDPDLGRGIILVGAVGPLVHLVAVLGRDGRGVGGQVDHVASDPSLTRVRVGVGLRVDLAGVLGGVVVYVARGADRHGLRLALPMGHELVRLDVAGRSGLVEDHAISGRGALHEDGISAGRTARAGHGVLGGMTERRAGDVALHGPVVELPAGGAQGVTVTVEISGAHELGELAIGVLEQRRAFRVVLEADRLGGPGRPAVAIVVGRARVVGHHDLLGPVGHIGDVRGPVGQLAQSGRVDGVVGLASARVDVALHVPAHKVVGEGRIVIGIRHPAAERAVVSDTGLGLLGRLQLRGGGVHGTTDHPVVRRVG